MRRFGTLGSIAILTCCVGNETQDGDVCCMFTEKCVLQYCPRSASVSFLTGEGTGAALLAHRGDMRIIIERLVKINTC